MKKKTWIIVGLVMLGIVMRSPITSIPAILTDIAAGLQVDVSSLGILTSIPMLMFALFSTLVPKVIARVGLEKSVLLTLLLMMAGSSLRVFQVPGLFLGTALLGMGIASINVLLPSLVTAYFPDKVGVYTTLYSTVMSVSLTVMAYLAVPYTEATSWQSFILLLSAMIGGALLLWLPNLRNHTKLNARSNKSGEGALWKNKAAWALLIFSGLQSLIFYTESTWLPTVSQDAGFSKEAAAALLTLYNIVSLPTSVLAPIVISRSQMKKKLVWVTSFCFLTIAGLLVIWLAPATFFWWGLGHILMGVSVAALFPYMLLSLSSKTRNAGDTARLSGMVQSGGYLLAAVGPVLLGYSKRLFHSWQPLILVLMLLAVVMIVSMFQFEKVDKIID
ncbi:MFS transporter [Streptococcus sp. DD13]|uniref:MFS transporter n=1 Tax=Streptococcus sp. DD13 TaxID=1777881 RepID=UPI0007935E54|nr:MFS transporter [Streptococcus sp. DD13]KXT79178.1 Cyanate permease [Streptococcus sp. DD13]